MQNKVVQISLFDIYTDVLDASEENKNEFIRLLEEHIDLTELIPACFYWAFYSWTGRKRIHPLESFIKALLLQRILGLHSVSLLRTILALSKELRDYCGFITIPDKEHTETWFTRFISDVFLFIAPDNYIDNQEDLDELMKVAQEKGTQSAHKLMSVEELIEDVELNPNKYTDDMVYMCSEQKWLLIEFAESVKFIFGDKK